MNAVQYIVGSPNSLAVSFFIIVGFALLGLLYTAISGERPYSGLPEVKADGKGLSTYLQPQLDWIVNAQSLLVKGLKECSSCFQVRTGSGFKVIVPNRFADELRNHSSLSFNEAFMKDFFVNYPGFDGFRQGLHDGSFIQEVVRVKLTQSLNLITDGLVEETNDSLHDSLGENKDWEAHLLKQDLLDIVARLSSRVFLGKDLCRNRKWLQISKNYTVDSFQAANAMRQCSALLRPLWYWFIPECTRLRQEVKDARRLIMPEVQKRCKRAEEALRAGQKPPKSADTIGWMVEVAKDRKIDYVAGQLSLTTAAIHTTSETMTNCVIALCDNPEAVTLLREEMIRVLSEDGWSKVSLYKMKLLDSFLKEVQRVNALARTTMNRLVKKNITLSDGTTLPRGARIMVSDDKNTDATVYPDPAKFDAARFLRKREQPGEENRHQFVTTTAEHMGFGHGEHACPGRFFASNEIKIALCFLLLKYEFRYIPGQPKPQHVDFEASRMADPMMKVEVRRRKEEIDLMSPRES